MKINAANVALGLGLAIGLSTGAHAGGSYSDVGIKTWRDAPAAVPVPAPVPVPQSAASWYLRADIGIGFADNASITESGHLFGTTDSPGLTGPTPFGTSPSWFSSDFKTFVSGGIGAGYNWGRGFRTDLTAEARTPGKADGIGSYSYTKYEFVAGPPIAYQPAVPAGTITGTYRDHTEVDTKLFMANAYYDIANLRGLTPYVGAGIGFTYNRITRDSTLTETDSSTGASTVSTFGRNADTFGIAIAAMAGISYELTPSILLDVNYRYLWLQGNSIDLAQGASTSRVTIGDLGEHALRTGLRFNID